MLFKSTNIGGRDYLHYYFANARIDIQDFSNSKRIMLAKQKKVFDQYKKKEAAKGSKDMTQAQDMLNSIMSSDGTLGEQLQNELSNIFNGKVAPSAASSSGLGNLSFFDVGQIKNNQAELNRMADLLVDNVGTFVTEAQKCLDDLIKVLTQYSDTIVTSALSNVAYEQASMTAQELCQKYLKSRSKSQVISTDDVNLGAALQGVARLKAQIESLRNIQGLDINNLSYTSSDSKSKRTVGSKGELVSVLVGKIGGNLTDVGGIVEEIATKMAVDVANFKMVDLWNKNMPKSEMAQIIRGKNISVSKKSLNSTKITENTSPLARTYNKGNVRVTINENKVALDFSMAVTRSKAKNIKPRSTVKLQEGTSLDTILRHLMNVDSAITKRYIYHIAASNEFTGKVNKSGSMAQSGRLVSAWRDLVEYAAIAYFMNALNGGKYSPNNNLLLVANRQVMSLSDIYARAIESPQGIKIDGGKQRNKFTALNTWIGSTVPSAPGGQVRSNKVQKDLVHAFNATKTTIKLDLSTLGYNIPLL